MFTPYRNVLSQKNHGPRAMRGYTYNGYDTVILENELVRAVVIVGYGAMVHEFLYKPRDIDVLYKNPGGLRPHTSFVPSSYESHPLSDHHPAGWYECFPSGSTPVKQNKIHIGFHGEIWGTPFELNGTEDSDAGCSATMTGYTHRTPWKLVKKWSLKKNDPTLYLEETATNLGETDLTVMWGQHPFYGAPFINGECTINFPATGYFDTADEPMIRKKWPALEPRDLRQVGAVNSDTGKMIFVTDFDRGFYRINSPAFKLALELEWDADKFPYCWMYECCSDKKVQNGRSYGLAVEPFSGLPKAIEEGHGVIPIKAHASESAAFAMRFAELK